MRPSPISLIATVVAISAATPATAQKSVADFYKDRTVTMIVASSAGGGYNAYGRTIAKHIVKHIPGNPTVIVKNMPGAGGRKATAYVAKVAPKDGTVILGTQPGALVEPVLGDPKKIKYDPATFGYVGQCSRLHHGLPRALRFVGEILRRSTKIGSGLRRRPARVDDA